MYISNHVYQKLIWTVLLLNISCQVAWADDKVISALRQQAEKIQSIESSFRQETRIPMFDSAIVSEGTFIFKRPGCLLWEYTSPIVDGFAINGTKGSRWEGTRKNSKAFTAASDPIAEIIARQLLTWVMLDLDAITKEYSITVSSSQPVTLHLVPKQKDLRSIIEFLSITFTPQGVAKTVILQEAGGGTTTINFVNTSINQAVQDTAMF